MLRWLETHPPLALALILTLSLGLRLGLWHALGGEPQMAPDSSSYLTPAASLMESGSFSTLDGNPETVRTPGYPLFLAAMGTLSPSLTAVVIAQNILAIGTALLIGMLLVRCDEDGSGLLATALASMNFLLMLYADFMLSEILFACMITASFVLLALARGHKHETRQVALAAVIAGTAVLVRPIALYLFLPACIYILLCMTRKPSLSTLVFLLVFALAPAAWMVRNHTHTGQYSLSGISGVNLLEYQGAGTLAMLEDGEYASTHERIRQELKRKAQLRFAERKTTKPGITLDAVYKDMSKEIILEHPIALLRHMLRNTVATLLGNSATMISRITGLSDNGARWAAMALAAPLLIFAVIGLAVCWRRHRHLAILAFLFTGYFVGITAAGGVGGSRFRVPVEPILCLLAGLGIESLFRKQQNTTRLK